MNIKITTVAACALFFAARIAHAQKGLEIGPRINVQTSSLLNSSDQAAGPELDYKNNAGVAFGFGGTYMVNNHIGIGMDILYSKQGQGYKGIASQINTTGTVPDLSQRFKADAATNGINLGTTSYTARRDVKYIKIPIMLRYTGNNSKKLYFSSFLGPQINLLAGAKYQINGQEINLASQQMEPKGQYKKMTVDVAFGVGAVLNLSKNASLSLHLRLDYGLTNAEDKSKNYFVSGVNGGYKNYYPTGRATTNNATGGALISFNYKFTKKEKEPVKGKPGAKLAPRPGTKPGAKPAQKKK